MKGTRHDGTTIKQDFANRPKLTSLAKRKLSVARAAIKGDMKIVALQPKSKAPDTRFCVKGADSAVDDIPSVRRWLAEDPSINLGAVAKGSPVLVIDVDGPEGETALKRFGPLPETRETITRNGRHLYFRHGGRMSGSKINFEPKLDIIASGYVLLAESTHPEGGRYKSSDPAAPIAKLPGRITNAILARAKSPKSPTAGDSSIRKGLRDNRLTSLAGSFRRQGFDADVISTALRAVNADYCSPPLPEREVSKIIRSIVTRYDPADDELFESRHHVTVSFFNVDMDEFTGMLCSQRSIRSASSISHNRRISFLLRAQLAVLETRRR